jgi:hypothetical protein
MKHEAHLRLQPIKEVHHCIPLHTWSFGMFGTQVRQELG